MIFKFFYSVLFFLNSMLIISEQNFLRPLRFKSSKNGNKQPSYITKIVDLMESVKLVLKVPVIFCNCLAILYELILG